MNIKCLFLPFILLVPCFNALLADGTQGTASVRFPVVDGSYAPNLCRRINPDGSLKSSVTVTSQSSSSLSYYRNAPGNLIDGSDDCSYIWWVDPGQQATFQFTATVDLGETYLINKTRICWYAHWRRAQRWTISTSIDGQTFSPVQTVYAADCTPGDDAYWNLRFADRQARYVRIVGSGVSDPVHPEVTLGEICVFQSRYASPPSSTDGYSLGFLQGVTQSFQNMSNAWNEPNAIWGGAVNPCAYVSPKSGWNQDSIVDFDLGGTHEVSLMKLGSGLQASCWPKGTRLEVSSTATGTFVPIWSSSGALQGDVSVVVPANLRQVRRVRLVSIGSSQNGGNVDRLGNIEFFSPAQSVVTAVPRFPVVDGSYAPNLCRRINPDGSLKSSVTVTSQSSGSYPWYTNAPGNLIDGSDDCSFSWKVDAAQQATFQFTATVDLGETYLINKTRISWYHSSRRAERWTVSTSIDGQNFSPDQTVFAADTVGGEDAYWNLRFSDRQARFVRIVGNGIANAQGTEVALGEICVFQSKNTSPPASVEGYSLGFMQGVTQSFQNTSQAWLEPYLIWGGAVNPSSYVRPNPGWNQDSIVDFDLAGNHVVSLIKLGGGLQASVWAKGSRLEVSSSITGSFVPIWSSSGPVVGDTAVIVPENLRQVRRVRLVSIGSAQAGVNADRMGNIEFFSPVQSLSSVSPLAQIPAQAGQMMSAGVYDSNGRLVKTLEAGREANGQPIPIYWDGTDTYGQVMPVGEYEWRALVNNGIGQNIAAVGDSGTPPHGTTEALGGASGLAYDSSGSLYQCTWWVEKHLEVRKTSSTGQILWNTSLVGSLVLAADSFSVFVSVSPYGTGEDRVYRLSATDGSFVPFPDGKNYLVINSGRPSSLTGSRNDLEANYGFEAINGLAVDAQRLFVSNYLKNEVEVFDRNTGAKLGGLLVAKPLGLAIRPSAQGGELWVASEDLVKSFTYNLTSTFAARTPFNIATGTRPQALTLSSAGQLGVGDVVEGKVKLYNIASSGAATLVRTIGQRATPGIINDGDFRPNVRWAVALDPSNRLTVGDSGNRMLWDYDSSGVLLSTNFSEFQPQPIVFQASGEQHRLLSGTWEYEVDLSGTPHSGPRWYDGGLWKLAANWEPSDGLFFSSQQAIRVTLPNGRDYIVYMSHGSAGVAFYEISQGRMRRSFVFGTRWKGLDEGLASQVALWSWRDLNGNGLMDWNPGQSGTGQEGAFVEAPGTGGVAAGWELRSPGSWIDSAGNLWFARLGEAIVKVPLLGFDSANNPIYDVTLRQTIVPRDTTPEEFRANNLKTASSGDLFALGFSNYTGGDPWLWMGGKEIRRYTSSGNLVSTFSVPDRKTIVTFAFDPIDNGIFYTAQNEGANPEIRAWNSEGLCLAIAKPDPVITGDMGWVDGFMGLSAFTPDNVRHLVYAEDVWNGKSVLFEFADLFQNIRYSGSILLVE